MSEMQPVAAPTQKPVPAGWHADYTSGRMRWWNGVEWTDTYGAPIPQRRGTNHIFHLLMTLLTVGLWIPVWIIVGISNYTKR